MKHPHESIIKQWLEDTTQEIEMNQECNIWSTVPIDMLFIDKIGKYSYRIKNKLNPIPLIWIDDKPKLDEYEHLRNSIRDGKKIEYYSRLDSKWNIKTDLVNFYPHYEYRIYDPYRELKEAQEQGKRVVFKHSNGEWKDCSFNSKFDFDSSPERYKIVDYDCFAFTTVLENDINGLFGPVNIKLTKSGIDGKIKAEVVEK